MTLTIYETLEQGTPEWLTVRAGIVTASTLGQLVTAKTIQPARNDTARGLYATLIAERITGRVEPTYPNRAMQRGTILEDAARTEYELDHGPVDQIGFARRAEDSFIIGASPDGLLGTDGGLEIKSPSAKTHTQTVLRGEVPVFNIAQVQASLFVTGRAYWDFVSYLPGEPLFIKRVEPDPRWHAAIRDACEMFEEAALEAVFKYRQHTYGKRATPYWDPFDEGEEIQ